MGNLYDHYSHAPSWDSARWPNFRAPEFSCRHCGEYWYSPDSFDRIQLVRDFVNKPIILSSAHRCVEHNKRVGGAKKSQHLQIAYDITLGDHEPMALLEAAFHAGFGSFGYYGSFLHCDERNGRRWFSKAGRPIWEPVIEEMKR